MTLIKSQQEKLMTTRKGSRREREREAEREKDKEEQGEENITEKLIMTLMMIGGVRRDGTKQQLLILISAYSISYRHMSSS